MSVFTVSMTDSEADTIINGLQTAALRYEDYAAMFRNSGQPKLSDQFLRQAEQSRAAVILIDTARDAA